MRDKTPDYDGGPAYGPRCTDTFRRIEVVNVVYYVQFQSWPGVVTAVFEDVENWKRCRPDDELGRGVMRWKI